MSSKNEKILITGGAGFIGSHLIEEILKHSPADIFCIDRDFNPKGYFSFQKLPKKTTLLNCDIKNFKGVFDILVKHKIDRVFHLAAQPIVNVAYKNPLETLETNIMGTANILEACRLKNDLKSIVISSSYAVALPKQDYFGACHPYDLSKSVMDSLAMTYSATYGLPVAVAKFSNVYGPGDVHFNRVIPGIFEALFRNKEFLIKSDGKMVRQYAYVKDISRGCFELSQSMDKAKGQIFNFGSKDVLSVIDLIKKIEGTLNVKVNYKILNEIKTEMSEQDFDWSKTKKLLKWEPKTSIEQGIKEIYNWYKNFYF